MNTDIAKSLIKNNQSWPKSIKFLIFAFIIYFVWLFNEQYITPLAIGFIMAVVTYPVYAKLNKYTGIGFHKIFKKQWNFRSLSAIITMIVTTYIIIMFTQIMATKIIAELPRLVNDTISYVENFVKSDQPQQIARGLGFSESNVENANKLLLEKTKSVGADILTTDNVTKVLDLSTNILGMLFGQILSFIVFFLAWFNALTHGRSWLEKLFNVMPFNKEETNTIKDRLSKGINNVIYASLVSASVHSVIVFIIMSSFDSPYTWIATLITFLIGILPMSAAEFGYIIPVATAISHNPILGLILIPILELIVIYINYILIPRIIAADGQSSPLLILTSVLSGVYIFGIMGFVIGPIIMILVQTLWQILVERIDAEEHGTV